MSGITTVLAENIRRLREERDWGQNELAEKSKLSVSTVRAYEGERRWPERPYIAALATAFEVEEFELFAVYEKPTPTVAHLTAAINDIQKENSSLKKEIEALRGQSGSFVKEPTVQYQIDPSLPDDIIMGLQKVGKMDQVRLNAIRYALNIPGKPLSKKKHREDAG
jgi:transcriptional regulator with XRE-family HTH domain